MFFVGCWERKRVLYCMGGGWLDKGVWGGKGRGKE